MPAPRWLLEKPFAHRGLYNDSRPENSLAAIDAAVSAGFPIEIDVQVSSDGKAIVFHDWNLKKLTGRDERVRLLPSSEIRALRLLDTDQKVPVLEEVLDVIAGREAVLIEIKNRKRPCALEPELARVLQTYRGPYAIQSFNPFSLGWFRKRYPEITRGQISCSFDTDDMAAWKKKILSNYGMNWMSQPHFISHHWKQLPGMVPAFLNRFLNLPLMVWTVRNPEEMAAALKLGDNVFFEHFVPEK